MRWRWPFGREAMEEGTSVPAQAHGKRTSSYARGYFAVIKNTALLDGDNPFHRTHDIVDLPLTEPLPEGWEFCTREEAHAYITEIEGGRITSTMFKLI